MRVLIEARSLSAKGGGVKRYTENMINQLSRSAEIDLSVILDSREIELKWPDTHKVVEPLGHELLLGHWLNKHVPRVAMQQKADLIHFTKADVPTRKSLPTVVTIHDVIPLILPETQSWSRRWYWPRALKRAAQYSDHIMTISIASKNDIVQKLQVDPEKISVANIAIDGDMFHVQEDSEAKRVRQKYDLSDNYILFVGTRDLRKNVSGLVRAFSDVKDEIPHNLVVAGTVALKHDIAKSVAAEKNVEDRIRFIDFVEEADLPALYSGADLFVWPSAYEGWGLPPQEAMGCGTPTIVSNGGSLPEVVGEAGVVVEFEEADIQKRVNDAAFESKLGQAMLRVLTDRTEHGRMRAMGLERVKDFTWKKVATRTIDVYKSLV